MPASKRPLSQPLENPPAPKRRAGVTENLENADEAPVAHGARALAPMVPDHLRMALLPSPPQLRQGALAGVTARLVPVPMAPTLAVRHRPSPWAPMIPDQLRRILLPPAQARRREDPPGGPARLVPAAPTPSSPSSAVRLRPSAWAPMIPDHLLRAHLDPASAFRRGAPAGNAASPSLQSLNLNTYPNPSTCWPS